jgi:hypothetical protein
MRKFVSAALLSTFVAAYSFSAIAQTTTKPTGPADCKSTEKWDVATKTCQPK